MGVLLAEIQHQLATEAFNAQQLSNLLWALTILRLCTPEVRQLRQSLCTTSICHCCQIVSVC